MTAIPTFAPDGPLPPRRLAIEASAGTGKTYTLSTLAARYVVEEAVAIGEMLIVTFTRAAAAELKDRVRTRLVEFHRALTDHEEPADALLRQIRATDRAQRLSRVRAAITDFDSATITTIHGFAQQVTCTLGSTMLTDPDAVLVDDVDALTRQVATDLLVAKVVRGDCPREELPDLDVLCRSSRLALGNPDAVLVPGPDPVDSTAAAARLRMMVDEVTDAVGQRRSATGTRSFDDLLLGLRRALTDDTAGEAARRALRERYRIALIDEFQDTDPVQWDIFDAVFGHSTTDEGERGTELVLVGDPKQAIYAFRGANVHTYLRAAHAEGTELTGLGVNWRSDPAVLRATQALLGDVTFGDDGIRFQAVAAPPRHQNRSFVTDEGDTIPALSIRLTAGPNVPRDKRSPQFSTEANGQPALHRELANHVRGLLESALVPDEGHDDGRTRPLRPDDVAVLTATNREGPFVRDALIALGIPAVISRGDNVLESEASGHWHRLLAAVARPTDARLVRAAALSWFFGWDAAQAAGADLSTLQEQLHTWGETLSNRGVAAFVGQVRVESSVAPRVLARPDGDRVATDLDHIGELLSRSGAINASPTSLLTTFEQLSGGNGDGDPEADLAARRVESESCSVQIMTTFVAKGLEFPVVCCPSAWHPTGARAHNNIWWDSEADRRTIDVASKLDWGPADALAERERLAAREAVGSNLRVLYVALTRARHHTAVWWLPTKGAWNTGLARVLFARDGEGHIDPVAFTDEAVDPLDEEQSVARLAPVVEAAGGDLEVIVVDDPLGDSRPWSGADAADPVDLEVATLDHPLDRSRSRWSFTAVTSRAHDEYRAFDPFDDTSGDGGAADEGATVSESEAGGGEGLVENPQSGTDELPLGAITGGAGFGTLVHEVLEIVDFTAPDLESEVSAAVNDRLAWNPWPVDPDRLGAGLVAVVRTPLGPLFGHRSLADLAPTERLDEMTFDFTLAEGGTRGTDAAIGRLLLDHLPGDDPQRPWAETLAAGPFSAVLAGHLTGSIDLVARIHHDDGMDRFVVCDYKTNRLARPGVTATAAHFHPDRLPEAMAEHHYPLQALLYTVALHRYLRWRLADYDPALHLGGTGYLFVRGMVGPDTPTVHGVPHGLFDWRPSAELIIDLSDLLDGTLADRTATT